MARNMSRYWDGYRQAKADYESEGMETVVENMADLKSADGRFGSDFYEGYNRFYRKQSAIDEEKEWADE